MMLGEPISTREFLSGYDVERLREPAMDSLHSLLEEPNLRRFIKVSRNFAEKAGIFPEILKRIPAGAMGSQIMLGNSIFFIDGEGGIRTGFDNKGARVVG